MRQIPNVVKRVLNISLYHTLLCVFLSDIVPFGGEKAKQKRPKKKKKKRSGAVLGAARTEKPKGSTSLGELETVLKRL